MNFKNHYMGNYIQKFTGLFIFALFYSNVNSQTIQLINNPDKGSGVSIGFKVYDNKLFLTYKTSSDTNRLAFYDGVKINTFISPKGYGNVYVYENPLFNNRLYFTIANGANRQITQIAEFNSDSIRVLENPTNTQYGYNGGFAVYNKKMYYQYRADFFNNQLAEFDGNKTKIITTSNGAGILSNFKEFQKKLYFSMEYGSDKIGLCYYDGTKINIVNNLNAADIGIRNELTPLNNKLYFGYYGPELKLAESDGLTIKTYPNPVNGAKYDYSPIILNGKLYFRYQNTSSKFQFATLDSTGIKLFPNPDNGMGVNSDPGFGGGNCYPIIYNNAIYFKYSNISEKKQLAKFDGISITLVNNPKDTIEYYGAPMIYNNNLILKYISKSGIVSIAKYDSVSLTLINNPDLGTIDNSSISPTIYNNAIYFQYKNVNGINQLAKYSDVNSNAAPTVGNFYNINRICDGDSVKLVGGIFPINYSYVWYLNEQEIPNVIGPTIYAKEGGYYSVSYKYANGQISLRSEPYKITKDTLPLAPIISSNDSLAKCRESKPITLKSTTKSGISWYREGILIQSTTDSTLVTSSVGTYYAKSSNGTCNSLNSNSLIIRNRSSPQKPFFTTTKYSFCSGDSISLTVANINKGDSIRWYYGAKSDITNILTKVFTDTTKLYVTRTDSLKCSITSDTVTLTKTPLPSTPNLTRDSSSYLVASAKGITWYKDGAVLNDTSQKIKPATPGSYTAKTTQNGCTSTLSSPYYYLVTDIINLSTDEFIKLAPNPFINQLNFDFVVKGYQRLNIEVFDIATGSKKARMQNLTPGVPLYLGQLSAGTYFIKVSSNDGKINYQFKMIKL